MRNYFFRRYQKIFNFAAPYIKQCRSSDPALVECVKESLHHLRPWLKTGIPEIQVSCRQQLFYEQFKMQFTSKSSRPKPVETEGSMQTSLSAMSREGQGLQLFKTRTAINFSVNNIKTYHSFFFSLTFQFPVFAVTSSFSFAFYRRGRNLYGAMLSD